jgi:hypothetical protein
LAREVISGTAKLEDWAKARHWIEAIDRGSSAGGAIGPQIG